MIADLYICNDTFAYNGQDSVVDVCRKLADFQKMLQKVREYPEENKLFLVKAGFGETSLFDDGKTVLQLLSDYLGTSKAYGKDVLTILQGIFKHCQAKNLSLDEMKEYLLLDDMDNCSAILVLNPLEGYENHVQVLSTVEGWLKFRRNFLAKYPGDEIFFLAESEKYFPNLVIHPQTKTKIGEVLSSHPKQIVAYLSVLDDYFIAEFKALGGKDLNTFLPWFKGAHSLDDASFEGSKDDKFRFIFPNGVEAYCEPHLKMYKDDAGNDNQHCRIYFKKPSNDETVVYVGCICRHL